MMQQEHFQPLWPSPSTTYSIENHPGSCGSAIEAILDDRHEFSSSFSTPATSSGISFDSFLSTVFSDDVEEFPPLDSAVRMSFPGRTMADNTGFFDNMSSFNFEDVCKWYESNKEKEDVSSEFIVEPDGEGPWFFVESSEISEVSLDFPGDNMDVDDDTRRLCHLLEEYGAAVGNEYRALKEVIAKRVLEIINPLGEARERVAFHLVQSMENSGDYLIEESSKNIRTAFNVFYQNFPFHRFAHFTANAAILEFVPDGIDRLNIIDFNMGAAVQWVPVIQAISQKHVVLKLISIKLEDECNRDACKFEETKKRLYDHAKSFGLKLQIEQIHLDDLMTELKRMKKRGIKREWFAFNCMIGLPHMGKRRNRDDAVEFLNSAKVFLAEYANHRGLLTFGDGETGQNPKTCSDYASFFDNQFMHYQALFDSMQRNFPAYLAEARIAMESLFLAPYICSASWLQQWKETRNWFDFGEGNMLQGRKLSKQSILEAKEMVNEANSLYKVKVKGERENEMILEWKGTPLVRVSSWI